MSVTEALTARPRALALVSGVTAPLLSAALAVLLGGLLLGRKSIWVDESFSHEWAAKSLQAQTGADHWLYYATLKGWTAIVGDSEAAMRVPSVLAAGLAAAALVVLGRRLLGPVPGALAGLLLASNPFFVTWAQQARGYTLLVLFVILATLALERALDRPTALRWAIYRPAASPDDGVAGVRAAAGPGSRRGDRPAPATSSLAVSDRRHRPGAGGVRALAAGGRDTRREQRRDDLAHHPGCRETSRSR